jgi:hypothetical protein
MSSVVISGDVSGSVTLQAPSAAGSVTVTLPAASGTMASLASVTANGVAYVNSSGQPTSGSALTFNGSALAVTGNTTSTTVQIGTNPAGVSIGVLGIPNQKRVYGRNAANSADVNILYVDGSNGLVLGPSDAAVINSSGQLLVGTTTSAGAVSNTKRIVGGSFSSFNGVLTSVSSGVAYTMFTMTADFTSYMVTVSALVSTAAYSETAIVHLNNTAVSVTIIAPGSAIAISNSGLAIQVVQSSGATVSELLWSAMRIT